MMPYLRRKWGGMGRRERALGCVTAALAMAAVADLAVYEPLAGGLGELRKQVSIRQGELAEAARQRADIAAELASLRRASLAAPGSSASAPGGGLWSQARVASWVARTQKDFGEDLRGLSVSSAGSVEAGYHMVYAHEVGVEAVSSWDTVAAYMEWVGEAESLRLEKMDVAALPDGTVRLGLRFRMLSGERFWQDPAPPGTAGALK